MVEAQTIWNIGRYVPELGHLRETWLLQATIPGLHLELNREMNLIK